MNPDDSKRTVKSITIVGLGETGLSVARFLHARGMAFRVIDSRDLPPGRDALFAIDANIELECGPLSGNSLMQADMLIVSPGVSVHVPEFRQARQKGIEIIGDIELFARHVNAPVIAITGSNGKSTVTTLLAEMASASGLRVRAGGNLMPPALDLLDGIDEGDDNGNEADLYVLELSSFQLETTYSLKPVAAVVLNISEDHMDRYTDMDAYARSKASIYKNASVRIINRDDARADDARADHARANDARVNERQGTGQQISYSLSAPQGEDYGLIEHEGATWLAKGQQPLMPESSVCIPGRHNISNALAALALGDAFELPLDTMLEVLRTFPGLPHRCQWVAELDVVQWFNDSKGTNVGATMAALDGLPGKTILIAGGVGKSADFRPLRPIVEARARAVILIGRDASLIDSQLTGTVPLQHAASMKGAVRLAYELAEPGDNVLLSPACASFDMYSNYQQRGDDFVRLVLALQQDSGS